jgi:hypothetical protein
MWIGRQDLRNPRIIRGLAVSGVILALLGSWVGAWIGEQIDADGVVLTFSGQATLTPDLIDRLAERENATPDQVATQIRRDHPATEEGVEGVERLADSVLRTTSGFQWSRLFDAEGHSQMPAWVSGAIGTSLVVIATSMAVARRRRLAWLTILGQMALTFYAFQAIVIRWTPTRSSTTMLEEYVLCAGLLLAFLAFAVPWSARFARGPLETVLRIGSAPRRAAPVIDAPTF